jgi:succinyl-diaminopimelate desuccinylase
MISDDELQSRLTALTRDLILIPSTEHRPDERERCFEFLHHHLDSLPGVRLDYFESNGHQSVVVLPAGIDAPGILLCGHLDVIDHPQPHCYRSKIEDGRIYGPGSGDMKGQISILVELMRSLQTEHPGLSLGLVLTSDEERGGWDGVRFLIQEKKLRCGHVIIPDGGSLNDVTVEEKGVIHIRVTATGHEAHGARPWLGQNALELLWIRLARVREHFDRFWPTEPIEEQVNHWFPTCSITICETENATANRIPDRASAVMDIRFPPPHTVDSMIVEITQILGAGCQIELMMTAEPTHLDPDPLFCEITQEVTGQPVRHVRASGGSDSRFFRQFDIPVNLSRPLVGNLHALDEWIDVASMVKYYRICEQYILRKLQT